MKVLVAMSGGLKSLVTAWLLKKQGMQVRGVYLDLIGAAQSQEKVEALERKLGISIQIIPAEADYANRLAEARESAIEFGETIDESLFFHQSFLFPKLMELKEQHQFTKVATGHRTLVQEDQVSKVFRVFQNADGNFQESLSLLGRNQNELSSLVLPLGSIPSSMFGKLSKELDVGTTPGASSTWTNEYIPQASEMELNFEVYSLAGLRIGSYSSVNLPTPGMLYRSGESESRYRVTDLSFQGAQMIVTEEKELECQEVHFQNATWFSRDDLGLKPLTCGLVAPGHSKALPVRLLQYEGGRIKGFLNQPLQGEEANIFKGQTVLWVEGTEILGGGRVLGTR